MSSIDWLGKVNPSWGYAPLFTLGDPKKKPNKGMLESNLLSLSYGRIIRRDIESSDGLVPASYETYQIVEPGDTVLRFTDLQNDQRSLRSGLVEERGIITSAYLSFTPDRRRLNPAFFAHMMRAVDLSKVFYRMGSGVRQSLNWSEFSLMRLPLPPLETQQRIADYLDRETTEIDAAVADLDKYVELLERRKLSRIESALNKVDHRMCPVGLLADVTLGKMVSTAPPKVGGLERHYLRAAHVQPGGRLDFTVAKKKMWFSEMELKRLDLLAGDVVVVEGGAGFGRSAYLESDLEEWGFQNSINRVRVDPSKADGRFVQFMLNRALLNGSIGISVDTATLPHFTAEKLARFRIPFCEIQKQKQISQEIHEDIMATNLLIAESTALRDLLLKRRSVLITEVVTGRKQV